MPELPPQVLEYARKIAEFQSHELRRVSEVLIEGASHNPDLIAMWQSLERQARAREIAYDTLWVAGFLGCAKSACEASPYELLSDSDRKKLAKKLRNKASDLVNALQELGLDAHVVRQPNRADAHWRFYEDMTLTNQARCDSDREPKLLVSNLVKLWLDRAGTLLETEYYPARAGSKSVRFCRRLVDLNETYLGMRLHQVVATASNALMGSNYSEQDVINLMKR